MLTRMRTTVVIEDGLLHEAKLKAASRGITLSQLLNEALRAALTERAEAPPRYEVIGYGAGLPLVHHEPSDFKKILEDDDLASFNR
jgi:hypothetical protein